VSDTVADQLRDEQLGIEGQRERQPELAEGAPGPEGCRPGRPEAEVQPSRGAWRCLLVVPHHGDHFLAVPSPARTRLPSRDPGQSATEGPQTVATCVTAARPSGLCATRCWCCQHPRQDFIGVRDRLVDLLELQDLQGSGRHVDNGWSGYGWPPAPAAIAMPTCHQQPAQLSQLPRLNPPGFEPGAVQRCRPPRRGQHLPTVPGGAVGPLS
jgi:hypothetical protein